MFTSSIKLFDAFVKSDATKTIVVVLLSIFDSRSIIIVKSIVEVAYNTQNAVDDKQNLIVHTQATNTHDGKALHKAAIQAKENLHLQKEDILIVLAE